MLQHCLSSTPLPPHLYDANPSPLYPPDDAAAPPSDQGMRHAPPGASAPSAGGRKGYSVVEASASALSVAALVFWTVAVTVWTGFQVVQNAL